MIIMYQLNEVLPASSPFDPYHVSTDTNMTLLVKGYSEGVPLFLLI